MPVFFNIVCASPCLGCFLGVSLLCISGCDVLVCACVVLVIAQHAGRFEIQCILHGGFATVRVPSTLKTAANPVRALRGLFLAW